MESTGSGRAPQPGVPDVARESLAAARRLRAAAHAYGLVSERDLAARLESWVWAALRGLERGSPAALVEEVARTPLVEPAAGVPPEQALRAFEELENALLALLPEEREPSAAPDAERTARALLRQAQRVFIAELVSLSGAGDPDERRLAAVLDALPQVVGVTDDQRRVRYVNARVRDLFRVEPAAVVGLPVRDALGLLDLGRFAEPERVVASIERASEPGGDTYEEELQLRDGRAVLVRSVPLEGGAHAGRIGFLADITLTRSRLPDSAALLRHLDDLRRGTERVLQGVRALQETVDPRAHGPQAPPQPVRRGAVPAGAITRRECEVLTLLSQGLKNDEIAGELGLASETVRTYVQRALEKLGAETRTQAVALALKQGLIE